MWVFGYGSLMWGGWENDFGCTEREHAVLAGYMREFIKGSVRNWGSADRPCPTLALLADEGSECHGIAFAFSDAVRDDLVSWLQHREGRSFVLREKAIRTRSGEAVMALVPIIDASAATYLGGLSPEARAQLARSAQGEQGTCLEYVRGVREELAKLGIADDAVDGFWMAVSRE